MSKSLTLIFFVMMSLILLGITNIDTERSALFANLQKSGTTFKSSNVLAMKINNKVFKPAKILATNIPQSRNITDRYFIGRMPYNISSILQASGLDNVLLYDIENYPGHRFIFYITLLNAMDINASGIMYRNFTISILLVN